MDYCKAFKGEFCKIRRDAPPKRNPPIKPPIPPSSGKRSLDLNLGGSRDPGTGKEAYTAPVPLCGNVLVLSRVRNVPENVKTRDRRRMESA